MGDHVVNDGRREMDEPPVSRRTAAIAAGAAPAASGLTEQPQALPSARQQAWRNVRSATRSARAPGLARLGPGRAPLRRGRVGRQWQRQHARVGQVQVGPHAGVEGAAPAAHQVGQLGAVLPPDARGLHAAGALRCSTSLRRIQSAFCCSARARSRRWHQRGALTRRPSSPTTKPMLRRRARRSS